MDLDNLIDNSSATSIVLKTEKRYICQINVTTSSQLILVIVIESRNSPLDMIKNL